MKNLILYYLLISCFQVFGQKTPVQKPLSNANIEFAEKQHDFGDVVKGETVSHNFVFKNTGTEPLIILNVQTTCGCTAPTWPKEPIPPGESGNILVNFNSTKKIGRQNKIITVYTNGQKPEDKLKIVCNILPEPNSDSDKVIKVEEK
jgi:hypothetical protein